MQVPQPEEERKVAECETKEQPKVGSSINFNSSRDVASEFS